MLFKEGCLYKLNKLRGGIIILNKLSNEELLSLYTLRVHNLGTSREQRGQEALTDLTVELLHRMQSRPILAIEDLNMSSLTTLVLLDNKILTTDDLARLTEQEAKTLDGLGTNSFLELVDKMQQIHLHFAK